MIFTLVGNSKANRGFATPGGFDNFATPGDVELGVDSGELKRSGALEYCLVRLHNRFGITFSGLFWLAYAIDIEEKKELYTNLFPKGLWCTYKSLKTLFRQGLQVPGGGAKVL